MSGDPARDERLRRLFQAKHEGDTDFLLAALSHYGGDEVGLPAAWLAEAGETRAIPPLTRLLSASSPHARRSAAKALEELGPPESAKGRLIELAKDDPDAPARSWAIGALGKYKERAMIPMIVAFLGDDDWRVRNGAAAALGDIGDPSTIEPLRRGQAGTLEVAAGLVPQPRRLQERDRVASSGELRHSGTFVGDDA